MTKTFSITLSDELAAYAEKLAASKAYNSVDHVLSVALQEHKSQAESLVLYPRGRDLPPQIPAQQHAARLTERQRFEYQMAKDDQTGE